MSAVPAARSSASKANKRSTSGGVNDAVGSSRIRSFACAPSARAIASSAPIDPRPRPGGLQPEGEVFGDAEIGEERWMLMNRGNAERPGSGRCEHLDRTTVIGDRAGVGRQRARDGAHECRFAGAVFTDERVDLAAAHLERRVDQRAYPGEVFCEMFNDEHGS